MFNILALGVIVLLVMINRRHPMMMHGHGGHQLAEHDAAMEHMGQDMAEA